VKIQTRKFGEIEIDETKTLTMPEGLPGFPGFEKFVLLEDPKTAPFCWFQSIEAPDLSLIVMNPVLFKADYAPDLSVLIEARGWENVKSDKILTFVVINIQDKEDEKSITANLMGPIVINLDSLEAVQVAICDTGYSHQYDVVKGISESVKG